MPQYRQRERMAAEKSWWMQSDSCSANTCREIYNTFCLFGGYKIPLFLRFRVIVFNLLRGSFLQSGVMQPSKGKRLFISQDGVKMRMGSFYRLVKDGLWSELAGQLGGRRAQTLRVLSLRSSKPALEGWLCPSLVLWPRASYLMILSLSLHIFEWEGSRYDQVNVVQV